MDGNGPVSTKSSRPTSQPGLEMARSTWMPLCRMPTTLITSRSCASWCASSWSIAGATAGPSAWTTIARGFPSCSATENGCKRSPSRNIASAGRPAKIRHLLNIAAVLAPTRSIGRHRSSILWNQTTKAAPRIMAIRRSSFPPAGSTFLGFQLQSELGRGAFGRVYLARQGDLANRPVALKISTDLIDETQTLAQLQHTNIVPIYSVHRSGRLQAVCMPYLGPCTLAHVLTELRQHPTLPDSGADLLGIRERALSTTDAPPASSTGNQHAEQREHRRSGEEPAAATPRLAEVRATTQIERLRGLGYVEAVLWMAARVADGLAHAHERGILHRDLKPANILLGDDGEPLLLDFNLAADTKLRGPASAALIGGTLPYMAPEHLRALRGEDRTLDARCDLYSLGVILFELLTGNHPFETPPRPSA